MTDLRMAVLSDLPQLLGLAHVMHAESRYAAWPLSEVRVADLIASLIQSPDGVVLVADDGGQIVGGMVGMVSEHWFTETRHASEFALFIEPARRGGSLALRILRRFEDEARARGAAVLHMGITTGVAAERTARLYEHMGCELFGPVYMKEL